MRVSEWEKGQRNGEFHAQWKKSTNIERKKYFK